MNRRQFLATTLAAAPVLAVEEQGFSFALLGDLHYDKMEHHDLRWLPAHHPGDLSQIKNYSRITAENTPRLFETVKQVVADQHARFVIQVGDLVEGLCGSDELAARQNLESLDFVERAGFGVPFLFTKGNHDVTGDGAVEAFKEVFHPFLGRQARTKLDGANYTLEHSGALFCFFDAYDKRSLEWLEAVLAARTARHCFVIIHPPVVPYGARATWHLYATDEPRRAKLLALLGKHNAIVLGGHIHRYNALCRETPGGGRFVQFALSSVVNAADPEPATELDGVKEYTPDQIRVEPKHSPETAEKRRAVYAAEASSVKAFAYADLPGHALVMVKGDSVSVSMHRGITRDVYRQVNLTELMRA